MGLTLGLFSNQLDNRGTGNALYDYAHYNEQLLGNSSIVLTKQHGNHDTDMYNRFIERFGEVRIFNGPDSLKGLDALYHIKSGVDDGTPVGGVPYLVHSVFDNQPHGTVYATVSPWMGRRFNLPVVPHMVHLPTWRTTNLRRKLGIPEDAVVFGRHGGTDSFDIEFAKSFVGWYVEQHPNVYFLFLNTDRFVEHPRVIHLPATANPADKQDFINTCDAMIHARSRGETFGIAVGEFAINSKPIITYSESHEKAHLEELGHFALDYKDEPTLEAQLDKVRNGVLISWGYGQYTPENVMSKFKEVFLSAVN